MCDTDAEDLEVEKGERGQPDLKASGQDLQRKEKKEVLELSNIQTAGGRQVMRAAPLLSRFVIQQILLNLEMMRLGYDLLPSSGESIERQTLATSQDTRHCTGPAWTVDNSQVNAQTREATSKGRWMKILRKESEFFLIHVSFLTTEREHRGS